MTFLLAGKHGSLTDAIILAYVKPSERKIVLLNVPRDLFVNNRKINSIWMLFGMEEFKRQLANVTGYHIDKYVLVDMYAFIEIIDNLGGIDITLEESVIDPTYRTYDNGEWGTLHYPPGTYHLNGRQVLRLARSRHFSSDFKRAERQQLILHTLQSKALSMSSYNTDNIVDILKVCLEKTESDIAPQEALTYLLRFKSFDVERGHVISTANVLASKKEHTDEYEEEREACEEREQSEEREACLKELEEFDHGAYILLPHEENWQLIKWYVWKAFEG